MSLKRVVLISSQVKGKDSRPKFFIQFLCLMGEKIQKVKKPEVRKKIYLISCIEILHRIKMSHFVWARTKWVYSSLKCKIASYTSLWVEQYHPFFFRCLSDMGHQSKYHCEYQWTQSTDAFTKSPHLSSIMLLHLHHSTKITQTSRLLYTIPVFLVTCGESCKYFRHEDKESTLKQLLFKAAKQT